MKRFACARLTSIAIVLMSMCSSSALPAPSTTSEVVEDPVVTKFRDYLRIQSVHPDPHPGYEQATEWLRQQAEEIGLDFHYLKLEDPNEFAVWMTWNGTNPSLKSVLLDSHMDVVAVNPPKWTYPPFEAHKDPKGIIYARGASDMKSVTVAELEAVRRLKKSNFQPLRTIHLLVMPEEEESGRKGMVPFVKTEEFKNLNVGIDIDEAAPSSSNNLLRVTYAEKSVWQFNITANGDAIHVSLVPNVTPGQRLGYAIDRLMEFRKSELDKLQNPNTTMEDITLINLSMMGGGIGPNTIPGEVWAFFDMRIRLRPGWNFTDVENMLLNITEGARLGSDSNTVTLDFITKSMDAGVTAVDDSNIWWTELQNTCREIDVICEPYVFPAITDGRLVRALGIPVFGFCPFLNTPPTAHQDNEYISEVEFLKGIPRYEALIKKLAMVPENLHP